MDLFYPNISMKRAGMELENNKNVFCSIIISLETDECCNSIMFLFLQTLVRLTGHLLFWCQFERHQKRQVVIQEMQEMQEEKLEDQKRRMESLSKKAKYLFFKINCYFIQV